MLSEIKFGFFMYLFALHDETNKINTSKDGVSQNRIA